MCEQRAKVISQSISSTRHCYGTAFPRCEGQRVSSGRDIFAGVSQSPSIMYQCGKRFNVVGSREGAGDVRWVIKTGCVRESAVRGRSKGWFSGAFAINTTRHGLQSLIDVPARIFWVSAEGMEFSTAKGTSCRMYLQRRVRSGKQHNARVTSAPCGPSQ